MLATWALTRVPNKVPIPFWCSSLVQLVFLECDLIPEGWTTKSNNRGDYLIIFNKLQKTTRCLLRPHSLSELKAERKECVLLMCSWTNTWAVSWASPISANWTFGSIVGNWRKSTESQLACLSYDRSTILVYNRAEVQNISAIWWCIRAVCKSRHAY